MIKQLSFILGFILAALILFISCTHENVIYQLVLAILAGFCVYLGAYRKLDLDDANFYIFVILAVVLSFALEDLFLRTEPNFNLLIYLGVYLLGSIPFGLVLAKIFANVDIKASGSKSIGATNVLRVVKENDPKLAKKLAIATLLCDFSKAALPILVLKFTGYDDNMLWSVGFFVVLGHCFSAYLRLDGGKGVASGAGVMAVLLIFELIIGLVAWFVVAKLFKISSLASLVALVSFLIASFILHYEMSINTHAPILFICFIIVYKHLPNIKRLIFKEECKVV